MSKRSARLGDWVRDVKADYLVKLNSATMACLNLFIPVRMSEEFLLQNGFKAETIGGETSFYRNEGKEFCSLALVSEGKWRITIANGEEYKFFGRIMTVADLQHCLEDCDIVWSLIAK